MIWKGEKASFAGNEKPLMTTERRELAQLKKAPKEAEIERNLLKQSRQHLLQWRQQLFRYVKDHQHVFAVGKMCRVFRVSRRGYCHWQNRKRSQREGGIA